MKVTKRILSKRYYTPKEVEGYIGSNRILYHNLLYTNVAKALCKLPMHIADKVIKKCFFITYSGRIRGHCFAPSLINNRTIIYISWHHLKRAKQEKIEHTILHEIAHWFLKHGDSMLPNSHFNSTVVEVKKKEMEADHIVKKWLQEYEKADPLTKKSEEEKNC